MPTTIQHFLRPATTRLRSWRRYSARIAVVMALVVSSIAALGGTALAAYPESSFYTKYGNSVAKGKIVWYNLSAAVKGTLKSAGECRRVYVDLANGVDADFWESDWTCGGNSIAIDHTFRRTVAGGWTYGTVWLIGEGDVTLDVDSCYRVEPWCHDA